MKFITRPWGTICQITHNRKFTINIIKVRACQRFSLQSHQFRDELWILVAQGSVVEIGEKEIISGIINFIWIPRKIRHRLSSRGRPAYFAEFALGEYNLSDIVRYEDDYNRIV